MGARETALEALITCRRQSGWSNAVLKQTIARDRLDSRDAALATKLCYGVVQNRGRLDFYLAQLLKGSIKKLHPAVRDILHLGLYQIYDLDKIPDSAAVNESVCLARKYGPAGSERLVNGVLRSAVRTKGTLTEPTSYADLYSHPDDLISLLKTALPKGTLESVLKADHEAPQTVIQVNTLENGGADGAAVPGGNPGPAPRLDAGLPDFGQHRQPGEAALLPGGAVLCSGPGQQAQCPLCPIAAGVAGPGLLRRPRRQELCRGHFHGRHGADYILRHTPS